MRMLIYIVAAFIMVPKLWHAGDTDRDAVRQVVQAWTAEHQDEIQAVVREVMMARLSQSRVGALATAREATDAARVEDARGTRRSYWQ